MTSSILASSRPRFEQRRLARGNFADPSAGLRFFAGSGEGGLLVAGGAGGGGGDPVFDSTRAGTTHVLASTTQTVQVGVMDPSLPAVLTIDSGDVVQYPDTWYMWGNEPQFGMSFEDREPIRRKYSQGPFRCRDPSRFAERSRAT